jgi:hypothetical protein
MLTWRLGLLVPDVVERYSEVSFEVSRTGDQYTIVNHSAKPLIGYAIQGRTATGLSSVFGNVDTGTGRRPIPGRVDFDSVAAGKPMQPGEQRIAVIADVLRCPVFPCFLPTLIKWQLIWLMQRPLDHYQVEEPPSIPSAQPTDSPAVYPVSQRRRLPQSQEPGLDMRGGAPQPNWSQPLALLPCDLCQWNSAASRLVR